MQGFFSTLSFLNPFLGVQDIFDLVVSANVIDNRGPVEKNFTQDQIEAVKKIRAARDNYERLGLPPGKVSFLR